MRTKKRIHASAAVGVRLGLCLAGLWILCMAVVTGITARFIFEELAKEGQSASEYVEKIAWSEKADAGGNPDNPEKVTENRIPATDDSTSATGDSSVIQAEDEKTYAAEKGAAWTGQRGLPGEADYRMLVAAAAFEDPEKRYIDGFDVPGEEMGGVYREPLEGCRTAALFFDRKGTIVHKSENYMYFRYVSENVWKRHEENHTVSGYSWLDLNDPADERYDFLRQKYSSVGSLYDYLAVRLTGYFEGSRFEPFKIAVLDDTIYHRALTAAGTDAGSQAGEGEAQTTTAGSDSQSSLAKRSEEPVCSLLDEEGLLQWNVRLDEEIPLKPGREPVTIYAMNPEMTLHRENKEVNYRGEKHDSLLSLLESMEDYRTFEPDDFYASASQFRLGDLIIFDKKDFRMAEDAGDMTPTQYEDAEYILMTAIQADPLRIAAGRLWKVYLWTGLAFLVVFCLLYRGVKKHLIRPVCRVNQGIASVWADVPEMRENPPKWAETADLAKYYEQACKERQEDKKEIIRLNKAVAFARTAESNRRQMTSNIAHELKTPLAVIHSYAEGLKEHIAEEKRDRYLDVILSETEHTDDMVLEMLDLSRLEAGKVKLSRDEFSLKELAESVFERLKMAVQAKDLQVAFDFYGTCTVMADKSRIGQVVENFASNAVKYTPAGGKIVVKIRSGQHDVSFSIENECEPLSEEALTKVWDTFYRTEESRSGSGTGLGLAIAKSIIELHGGKCFVRNTKTGVIFDFVI